MTTPNESDATEPPEPDGRPFPPRWTDIKTRVISGAAMAALAIFALYCGGWIFALAVIAGGLISLREWDGLTATQEKPGWKWLGLAYVAIPCASLIWLRNAPAGGALALYVLLAVWATDIGAYVAGKAIGGAKLAPAISPNKTWAGLGGGIGAAAVTGGIGYSYSPFPATFLGCVGMGLLLAIVSQAGDLFESWLKRRAGAKDSGSLIPGHGGLLDRIDGLMFAVPVFALLAALGRA